MLMRQKAVLALLLSAGRSLSPTMFVKLVFLLRQETRFKTEPSFYDFVPYKLGPFSFGLYRDLSLLRREGFVMPEEDRVSLAPLSRDAVAKESESLPKRASDSIEEVLGRYGHLSQTGLVASVYERYPWFALNSELPERRLASVVAPRRAKPEVYTIGYEGKSIDGFLNLVLEQGIEIVVDIRANPVSRKYGFSGRRLCEMCERMGFGYHHAKALGIPSAARAELGDYASYQRLMGRYETEMLPARKGEVESLAELMQGKPSVLVCVERDVSCCHRSRLANAIAKETGMRVVHL